MNNNLRSLVSDLHKEIAYAHTVSPLYDAVFSNFLMMLEGDTDGNGDLLEGTFFHAIGKIWKDKSVSTWFERPLLLAAALHRTVISKNSADLATFYATCGGQYRPADRQSFDIAIKNFLQQHRAKYLDYLKLQSLQTNEVSRGITLLSVLAPIWARSKKKIVLFEIGCSAGLNLLADRYGWNIAINEETVKLPGVPVLPIVISNAYDKTLALSLHQIPELTNSIAARIGCDLSVPDLTSTNGREMLEAMIWGDDMNRLSRLQQAISVQSECKKEVDLLQGDGVKCFEETVEQMKSHLKQEDIFCVFNTVVTCYFSEVQYQKLRNAIQTAFAGPLKNQNCLWVEHEPVRPNEMRNDAAKEYESLIRLSTVDSEGKLVTEVVAGTEMHPKNVAFFKLF